MVEVDGSIGEGGGQILRTVISLSALLGKPVRVFNIRAKRPRPGLQRQHMTAVRAVAELSSARVKGLALGSTVLEFYPGRLRSGSFSFNVGTAGSVTLVLQAALPVLAFMDSGVEVEVRGGTDVPWSPPVDYFRHVLSRLLSRMGFVFTLTVKRRGHYPRGGGIVRVRVEKPPRMFRSVALRERGRLRFIEGISHAVRLPKHVAERQARAARDVLAASLNVPVDIALEWYEPGRDPHLGPGSGIVLWAVAENSVLGSDSLGARGKPAEEVGREAANKLVEDIRTGMALDRHASDMLIPYAALACGESILGGASLSLHAETSIKVVELMVPEAKLEFVEGGVRGKPFVLRVRGVCFKR
ncbi:MAG: RNA 3'-phosphate cyclase [Hyperthermus sp.]|nr:MAG: RNA 3'-phosphate cyclase [Hyperthermus sp.]